MLHNHSVRKRRQLKHLDKNDERCCEDLILKHQFSRYHRFFLFSPMFLFFAVAVIFFASRGELPKESYKFLVALIILITIKEALGVVVSRRINSQILKPVEDLKRGLLEVSRGNYGVEVRAYANPEIADLVTAFNQMSQQLKASEQEKSKYENNRKELLASISHDLKTPITSINGFIDGILDGVADTPEKQEAYIRIIQQNTRYLNRLIDDLLLYSKLDLHKLNFEFTSLSIKTYLDELFMELALEQEENGVSMHFHDQLDEVIMLNLDPRHMTRAIRNIVANAVVYGRTSSAEIDFKLYRGTSTLDIETLICGSSSGCVTSGDWVSLTITDNGPGIPPDQLHKIFERFYRGDEARTMASGSSGLGLAIAKEIVDAHHGRIWATSTVGTGTTIGISLPLE